MTPEPVKTMARSPLWSQRIAAAPRPHFRDSKQAAMESGNLGGQASELVATPPPFLLCAPTAIFPAVTEPPAIAAELTAPGARWTPPAAPRVSASRTIHTIMGDCDTELGGMPALGAGKFRMDRSFASTLRFTPRAEVQE